MTAFNNTSRIAYGGGKLHLAFTGTYENDTIVFYTYSIDNGMSWVQPIEVPCGRGAQYPALALNSPNVPFILFTKWVYRQGG